MAREGHVGEGGVRDHVNSGQGRDGSKFKVLKLLGDLKRSLTLLYSGLVLRPSANRF